MLPSLVVTGGAEVSVVPAEGCTEVVGTSGALDVVDGTESGGADETSTVVSDISPLSVAALAVGTGTGTDSVGGALGVPRVVEFEPVGTGEAGLATVGVVATLGRPSVGSAPDPDAAVVDVLASDGPRPGTAVGAAAVPLPGLFGADALAPGLGPLADWGSEEHAVCITAQPNTAAVRVSLVIGVEASLAEILTCILYHAQSSLVDHDKMHNGPGATRKPTPIGPARVCACPTAPRLLDASSTPVAGRVTV